MISRCRASALLALSLAVITPTAYAGKPSGGGGKPGGGGSPPTYPPARHWQSMGASEAGGVYMFGGDSAAGQQMNDLWYFSVDSGQWTLITPTSRTQSLYGWLA